MWTSQGQDRNRLTGRKPALKAAQTESVEPVSPRTDDARMDLQGAADARLEALSVTPSGVSLAR